MSWWLFPRATRELQFDENWSYVYEKEDYAEAKAAEGEERGENWTHVALDPEHRLVLEAMPGKRTPERAEAVVEAAARRTGHGEEIMLTSDDYKPYRKGVVKAYGKLVPRARRFRLGRSPKARVELPDGLC